MLPPEETASRRGHEASYYVRRIIFRTKTEIQLLYDRSTQKQKPRYAAGVVLLIQSAWRAIDGWATGLSWAGRTLDP
jgi:hypothetical protein